MTPSTDDRIYICGEGNGFLHDRTLEPCQTDDAGYDYNGAELAARAQFAFDRAGMDDAGSYFLPIKYGRQQIELKKGISSMLCKNIPEVDSVLQTVRQMVLNGDFDDQLAKAALRIRKRFGADQIGN